MSILIIGDSFAADFNRDIGYQNILRQKYKIPVDNYGYSGQSNFKNLVQIKKLNNQLSDYKLIILIITSVGRLYIPDTDIGIAGEDNAKDLVNRYNNNQLLNGFSWPTLDQAIAAIQYYKHLKNMVLY